jgi:hypothetical protein
VAEDDVLMLWLATRSGMIGRSSRGTSGSTRQNTSMPSPGQVSGMTEAWRPESLDLRYRSL